MIRKHYMDGEAATRVVSIAKRLHEQVLERLDEIGLNRAPGGRPDEQIAGLIDIALGRAYRHGVEAVWREQKQ